MWRFCFTLHRGGPTCGRPHRARIRRHVRGECTFVVTESDPGPAEGKAGKRCASRLCLCHCLIIALRSAALRGAEAPGRSGCRSSARTQGICGYSILRVSGIRDVCGFRSSQTAISGQGANVAGASVYTSLHCPTFVCALFPHRFLRAVMPLLSIFQAQSARAEKRINDNRLQVCP